MCKLSIRLKTLRHEAELSQQEFATCIGISKSSVNMYERGEREPSLETLESIADYFNVDMNYLLGKSDIRNSLVALQELGINSSSSYTPLEQQIIKNYRAAVQPVQEACLRLLQIDPSAWDRTEKEIRHA